MRRAVRNKPYVSPVVAVALCATATLALACLPIPVTKKALAFPSIELVVQRADGTPLEGVRVLLLRNEIHPHWRREALDSREARTDATGRVTFAHEMHDKTDMPLMMHGVGFHTWQLCVEKEGYGTRMFKLFEQGQEVAREPDGSLLATYEQIVGGATLEDVKITLEASSGEDTTACSASDVPEVRGAREFKGIDIMPRFNPKH